MRVGPEPGMKARTDFGMEDKMRLKMEPVTNTEPGIQQQLPVVPQPGGGVPRKGPAARLPGEPDARLANPAAEAESAQAGGRRQTGRQSGRFKRGGGGANTSALSAEGALNASMLSQGSNEAQSRFMESLVNPNMAPAGRRNVGSLGRAEGARVMREGGRGPLPPARSEESVREIGKTARGRGKDKKTG